MPNNKRQQVPSELVVNLNLQYRFSSPIAVIVEIFAMIGSAYFYGFDRLYLNVLKTFARPIGTLVEDIHPFFLIHSISSLIWLVGLFATSGFGGRLFIRGYVSQELDFLEEILFGLGLGLGFFSLLMLAMGLAGLFYPLVLRITFIMIMGVILAFHAWRPVQKEALINQLPRSGKISFVSAIAGTIIGVLIAIDLIGALGPPTFYDTLVYHLGLPQLYLVHHRIFPTPYNVYSGIPFNSEMLYGLGLALDGEGLAKLIPWGISIALLLGIALWARRYANAQAGLFAALLFYSCPMVAAQTWLTLVELNWGFFNFLTIFGLIIGLERPEVFGNRWFVLVGAFSGLALGVKYNALPMVLVALLLLLWEGKQDSRETWGKLRANASMFLLGAILVAAPWFLKNIVFYHNPMFPFFDGAFGLGANGADWRGLMQDAHSRDLKLTFSTLSGFTDMFSILWSKEWDGSGYHSIGFAFLLLIPGLFFVKWESAPRHRCLLLYFLSGSIIWSLSSRYPRFIVFSMPLLAILISTALFADNGSAILRKVMPLVIVLASLWNCMQLFRPWLDMGGWKVVLGQETKSYYLQHGHPGYFSPYYAATEFVNEKLPPNSKTLFFQESRGYYCLRDFVATSYFAQDPFVSQVNESRSAEGLRNSLLDQGISYVLLNRAEWFRRGNLWPFSDEGGRVFNDFTKLYLRPVFQRTITSPPAPMDDRQWVAVYEIVR